MVGASKKRKQKERRAALGGSSDGGTTRAPSEAGGEPSDTTTPAGPSDAGANSGGTSRDNQRSLPIRSGLSPAVPVLEGPGLPPAPAAGIHRAGSVPVPDKAITEAEDKLALLTKNQMFDGFPGRPGYGTRGKPVVLRTNYVNIKTNVEDGKPTPPCSKYSVVLDKQLSKDKKRRLFEELFKESKFQGIRYATDYAQTIVTTQELDFEGADVWDVTLLIPVQVDEDEGLRQPAPRPQVTTGPSRGGPVSGPAAQESKKKHVDEAKARNTIKLTITRTEAFDLQSIMQYLRSPSKNATYAGVETTMQMLNIICGQGPNTDENIRNVGGNKFYPFQNSTTVESHELGGGLVALRGYYGSARPGFDRLLLNLNVTSGAFYQPIALRQLLEAVGGDLNSREAFVRMIKVDININLYGDRGKGTHRKIAHVVGFANPTKDKPVVRSGNADEVIFEADGTRYTVAQYFLEKYFMTVRDRKSPVINTGTKDNPTYFPMELCTVLPGQPFSKLLSAAQTTKMLAFAARPPNANALSIEGTTQTPGHGLRVFKLKGFSGDVQSTSVAPFGFRVGMEMLTVPGRILQPPALKYGKGVLTGGNVANGAWNLGTQQFAIPGQMGVYSALILTENNSRGTSDVPSDATIKAVFTNLQSHGVRLGASINPKTVALEPLTVANRKSNDEALTAIFEGASEKNINFLFIVLPAADKWLYARIKFFCDVKFGIQTICCVGSKLMKDKGQTTYMNNLALKFNIKCNGTNHTITDLDAPMKEECMLMGIDVTHPSPGSVKEAPSIASVVASINSNVSAWPGSVRCQTGKQEMVDGLAEMVVERLAMWRKKNGKYPKSIVLYRDGVSEGQYRAVLDTEIPCFYKAFEKCFATQKLYPKLTVVIVGKRHHTRFYPTDNADADASKFGGGGGTFNPKAGTVVDRHISGRILREFWLQAHQGLQGTARPAHYVVLKDENNFTADALEQFTHKLCYLFNRATKAVSICPPAYYADLLCERGRAYLFSVMGENQGSDAKAYDADTSEWTGGVHDNIKDTTWYI